MALSSSAAAPPAAQQRCRRCTPRAQRRLPRVLACAAPTAAQHARLADTALTALSPGVAPLLSSQPGVYAVYDGAGTVQYVGMSRKMSASLGLHLSDLPTQCASARLLPLPGAGKEELQAAWRVWVEEAVAAGGGAVPPGNTPDGARAWTARRAAPAKAELRLTGGKGLGDLTVPLERLIDDVVRTAGVVAFVKGTRAAPECGFSASLLALLEKEGLPYEVCNVLDVVYNPGLRDALKEYSAWPTLPQLYAHGAFLGGADTVAQLAAAGELRAKLEKPQS